MKRIQRRRQALRVAAVGLLPLALLLRGLAFAWPAGVEQFYSRTAYPWIALLLGTANGWLPVPMVELVLAAAVGAAVATAWRLWRRAAPRPSLRRLLARTAILTWVGGGVLLSWFLLAWGFNYARPPLRERMQLDLEVLRSEEVLDLASRFVWAANEAHAGLEAVPDQPTRLAGTRAELDAAIDAAYQRLRLPGDTFDFDTSPAKAMLSAPLFSRLGISGIFVPFTGEPLFNGAVPDVSVPVALAHEKAHQRGITDEGEANLAAVLACLVADEPYARYAAAVYAANVLVGEASRYDREGARAVAAELGPGPRQDLAAIRAFWERYRGRATRAAARVNDAFLRSNRVEGGVQSYGRVASMLVGVDRAGVLPALEMPPSQ
jgi:hypothetical protein